MCIGGQASSGQRRRPGLGEVASPELAALHADEDEPVRARGRAPVYVFPQLLGQPFGVRLLGVAGGLVAVGDLFGEVLGR